MVTHVSARFSIDCGMVLEVANRRPFLGAIGRFTIAREIISANRRTACHAERLGHPFCAITGSALLHYPRCLKMRSPIAKRQLRPVRWQFRTSSSRMGSASSNSCEPAPAESRSGLRLRDRLNERVHKFHTCATRPLVQRRRDGGFEAR